MTQTVEFELPSGKSLLIQVDEAPGQFREMGAGQNIKRKVEDIIGNMRETIEVLSNAFTAIGPRAADKTTVDFSFEISTNGLIKLLGADAKGGVKVSLTWENKRPQNA